MTETKNTAKLPEPIPVDTKKLIDGLGTIFGGVIQLLAAMEPNMAKELADMAINGVPNEKAPEAFNTGIKITTVKSEHSFEYLMFDKPIKRKKPELQGKTGYSWAGPLMRWCTNLLKTVPREKYLRELRKKYDVIEYIGIAADETERITHKCNSRPNVRLPLVEWGMTEADCLKYCKERGYDWGGLYEKFGRVSCWNCPLQPLSELRILYYDFPDLWKKLREWDEKTWRTFKPGWSVRKLEVRFDFEKEWQDKGNQLGTKEFRKELKKRLEGVND